MDDDKHSQLARIHPAWAPMLTILSCVVIVYACLTGDSTFLMLAVIAVPLALAASIQVSSVAPLATEVVRLREELAKLQAR